MTELHRTELEPEFASVKDTARMFGLSRTELFRPIAAKKIASIHYRASPFSSKGKRLIRLASIRSYLESMIESE